MVNLKYYSSTPYSQTSTIKNKLLAIEDNYPGDEELKELIKTYRKSNLYADQVKIFQTLYKKYPNTVI